MLPVIHHLRGAGEGETRVSNDAVKGSGTKTEIYTTKESPFNKRFPSLIFAIGAQAHAPVAKCALGGGIQGPVVPCVRFGPSLGYFFEKKKQEKGGKKDHIKPICVWFYMFFRILNVHFNPRRYRKHFTYISSRGKGGQKKVKKQTHSKHPPPHQVQRESISIAQSREMVKRRTTCVGR